MTDIKDLAQLVAERPEDYELRWRLAKKLYMAADYAAALEHLLALQSRWIPKVNVRRYLGATYYRLKRYDDAITELRGAVEEWPDEMPLREQLARVLDVAGHSSEADHVWQEIGRRDPSRMSLRADDSPMLAATPPPEPEPEKKPAVPSGLNMSAFTMGRVCLSCGAQNTDEFERCWKCHAELAGPGDILGSGFDPLVPTPSPSITPGYRNKPLPSRSEMWHIPTATLGGVCLLAGLYLSLTHFSELSATDASTLVCTTVREIFVRRLASSHFVLGLVLLVAWPASLWLAATLVPNGEVPARTVVILGTALASFGYLLSWGPPEWLGYLFAMVLLLALGVIALTFHMEMRRALAVWAIHSVLLVCVLLVVITAMEGFAVVVEYPAMARYARVHDVALGSNAQPGHVTFTALQVPRQYRVVFRSSGSAWLDGKASAVAFELTGAKPDDNLSVELKDENRTRFYNHADKDPFTFVCEIVPERPYQFIVDGKDTAHVSLTVRSLFRPEVND